MSEEYGTLKSGEPHPAAQNALEWIKTIPFDELASYQCAFSSCGLSGNRLAEVCSVTLNRLLKGQPVSDRYLLGCAWAIHELRSMKK